MRPALRGGAASDQSEEGRSVGQQETARGACSAHALHLAVAVSREVCVWRAAGGGAASVRRECKNVFRKQ